MGPLMKRDPGLNCTVSNDWPINNSLVLDKVSFVSGKLTHVHLDSVPTEYPDYQGDLD